MTAILQNLIDALRLELQQYGEMLALLDQQHQAVTLQGAEEVLRSVAAVNDQSAALEAARDSRQTWQRRAAEALDQPADLSFVHLTPLLPEPYRPLVTALVQENNDLLERVREIAQQNHALLQQSLDLMQRFTISLAPEGPPVGRTDEPEIVLMKPPEAVLCKAIA